MKTRAFFESRKSGEKNSIVKKKEKREFWDNIYPKSRCFGSWASSYASLIFSIDTRPAENSSFETGGIPRTTCWKSTGASVQTCFPRRGGNENFVAPFVFFWSNGFFFFFVPRYYTNTGMESVEGIAFIHHWFTSFVADNVSNKKSWAIFVSVWNYNTNTFFFF